MSDIFVDHIRDAGRILQQPFDSDPDILSRDDMITATHRAWKALHLKTLEEITVIDTIEERHRQRPIDGRFVEYLSHIRRGWRKINDGLVWELCGEHRHLVKRLCFYRDRGHLSSANPDDALRALETFNSEPMTIALWTDATSCVDVGDVMRYDAKAHQLCFIELKSGDVNTAILEMVSATASGAAFTELDAFAQRYGKAGVAQLERILRQKERNAQAISLIRDERGFDPYVGLDIEIRELKTPGEDYDEELRWVIEDARERGSSLTVVDGCLWIYVDATPRLTLDEIQQRFGDAVTRENPSLVSRIGQAFHARDAGRAVLFSHSLYHPMAKPPFLRKLEPETVASVTCGDLRAGVWLYLDWQMFGQLCESAGATFSWSSEREARRMRAEPMKMRPETVDGRLPLVTLGPVKTGVTGANMVELMFDGVRPRTLAARLVESVPILEEIARRSRATQ